MKKVNSPTFLSLLAAGMLSTSAPGQTTEDLYKELQNSNDKKETSVPDTAFADQSVFVPPQADNDVRSHTNKTASAPTWRVVKPTDHGFDFDILLSLYFSPTDSTWVAG